LEKNTRINLQPEGKIIVPVQKLGEIALQMAEEEEVAPNSGIDNEEAASVGGLFI
jgi:hypothetical protein